MSGVDTLLTGLLIAVLAVLIAILVVVLLARRKARQLRRDAEARRSAPPGDPFTADADAVRGDPRRLRPGDVLDIRSQPHAVRGSLHFTEGSWGWAEHLLDDTDGVKRWLSVEEDPDLELVLWTEVRGAVIAPGPKTVDFDGRRYAFEESGAARYTGAGTTGLHPQGTVRYYDYQARDGARLSFEEYGASGKWEVARGEPLGRHELQIFPGATS